jgi:hypothetical protein
MKTDAVDREPNPAVRHIIRFLQKRLDDGLEINTAVEFKTLDKFEKTEWTAALNNNAPYQRLQDWAEKQKLSVVYRGTQEYTISSPPSINLNESAA